MKAWPWFVALMVSVVGVGCFGEVLECADDDQCACPARCVANECKVTGEPRICEGADTPDGTAQPDTAVEPDAVSDTRDAVDTEETSPDTTPVLAAPTQVRASTDRSLDIEVTWNTVPGALSYRVERCAGACDDGAWAPVNASLVTEARFRDNTAAAADGPEAVELEASDNLNAHVLLTWDEVTAPAAPRYLYRVTALGEEELESAPSATASGHRAERPVIGYEVRIGDGGWNPVAGLVTEWRDSDAPAPTLDAGTVNASQGTYAELVRLTASGASANPGETRAYQVRAVTEYGPGPASEVAVGRRVAGALAFQWERSIAAVEADFQPLPGATSTSYDDTSAPVDGSSRFYRLVVSAVGADSAITAAVPGSRQPPPGLVGGVSASSDTPAHVRVTWQAVSGALGYHVYRDGVKLTGGGNGIAGTTFDDSGAGAPAAAWAAPSALVATQNQTDYVTLGWVAPARPLGTLHTYTVIAVNAAGESDPSAPASGRRAAPALTSYEVAATIGGSTTFRDVGAVTTFQDATAPAATISGGSSSATKGDHRAHVKLAASGATVGAAPSVSYQVRGVLADGSKTPLSTAQTGRRATGGLSWQWQRSAGTTPDGWTDIAGCASASCDDTGAPAVGEARWYRVMLSAPGAQTVHLTPVEGWRLAFVSVAAGGGWVYSGGFTLLSDTTCAVTPLVPDGGRVWCWGSNFANFLGPEGPSLPTRMEAFDQVTEVALGTRHGCARKADKSVWCWGINSSGQLGDGTTTTRSAPVRVGTLLADDIDANGSASCAVITNGQVWCWGANGSGQLGDGTTTDRTSPVQLQTSAANALTGASQVSLGSAFGCALKTDGTVWCWGSNSRGQLGSSTPSRSLFAQQVVGLSGVSEVDAGENYVCARSGSANVWCWGSNLAGQLGNGTTTDSTSPVDAIGLGNVSQLASGPLHACARLTNGEVRCWGKNTHRQLGTGTHGDSHAPELVLASWFPPTALKSASHISTGAEHTCAVLDGATLCWGNNGRLQAGAATGSALFWPVPVTLP